jgi:hypothetical protein
MGRTNPPHAKRPVLKIPDTDIRNNTFCRKGALHMRRTPKNGWLIILPLSAVLSIALMLTGTFAWLKASDSVNNQFKLPQFQFDIPAVDIFAPPVNPMNPGDDPVEKWVGAVNNGDLPGFVRLLAFPAIVASDGLTALPAYFGAEIIADLNTTDWADGGDGYYYYLNKLPAGQSAPNLFTGIRLAAGLDNSYKDASLTIEIKCEAIDTKKWNYRIGWWGSDTVPSGALAAVDQVLQGFAE